MSEYRQGHLVQLLSSNLRDDAMRCKNTSKHGDAMRYDKHIFLGRRCDTMRFVCGCALDDAMQCDCVDLCAQTMRCDAMRKADDERFVAMRSLILPAMILVTTHV